MPAKLWKYDESIYFVTYFLNKLLVIYQNKVSSLSLKKGSTYLSLNQFS